MSKPGDSKSSHAPRASASLESITEELSPRNISWAQIVRQSSGDNLDSSRNTSHSSLSSLSSESSALDKEIDAKITADYEQFRALLELTPDDKKKASASLVPDYQQSISLFEAVGEILKKHYDLTNYGNEEPLNRPTISDDIQAEQQKAFAIRGLKFVLDSILPNDAVETLQESASQKAPQNNERFAHVMAQLDSWRKQEDDATIAILGGDQEKSDLIRLRNANIHNRQEYDREATIALLAKYRTDPKFFNDPHNRNNGVDSTVAIFRGQTKLGIFSSPPLPVDSDLRPHVNQPRSVSNSTKTDEANTKLHLGPLLEQGKRVTQVAYQNLRDGQKDFPAYFSAPSHSASSSNATEQLKEDRMVLLQERIRVRLLQDCFFGKCSLQDAEKTMHTFRSIEPEERNFIKEFYSKATELFKASGNSNVNEQFIIPTTLKGQELKGFVGLLNDAQKYTGKHHTSTLAGISFAADNSGIRVTIKDTPGISLRPEGQMLQSLTKMMLEQARTLEQAKTSHATQLASSREAKSGRCSIM